MTKQQFIDHIRSIKATRWIRFGVVSLLYFFWVAMVGNPWLLLVWPVLIDLYITNLIPWGWWKNRKGAVRVVMAWVDAIVYALVLIYFVFTFVGQQYEIPSSSLEKSLLVGDRLWVNKTIYGARVPQTPVHFPLAHHTLPLLNVKSYLDRPQLPYHRTPGFREVRRGDIVVFNYPQGDTVATRIPNPDYYQICHDLRRQGVADPKAFILENPARFGELVVRPVDRRENYVKRTVGLPGERIRISSDSIFINGRLIPEPENVQYNYIIPVSGPVDPARWQEIGVRAEDHGDVPYRNEYDGYSFYDVPLTAAMKAEVEKWPEVIAPLIRESRSGLYDTGDIFPLGAPYGWTRTDMGEFWIPRRGDTLKVTPENYPIYERAIRTYEGNDLALRDGKIYINGKENPYYTFKMDYYWMMGDNRDRSADSRFWGFVPEDHIVGSPLFIIASFDKEKGWFDGKIRWKRTFGNPNPDAAKFQGE